MRKWVRGRFEVYARVCLLVAMVVTPLFFLKSTVGVFAVAKLTLLWCLMVVGLALWAIWRLHSSTTLPKARLIRYGACFVAIAALATAFSPYRLTALVGHYFVYGGLFSLELYFAVAFLVFAIYWKCPENLGELVKAGAIAGFLVTGYQLLQEAGLDWHTWSLAGGIAPWEGGALGNPNFTGGFLGATLPLALYLTVNSKEKAATAVFASLTFLQVIALWMTASRGGIAAAVTGGAVFGAAHIHLMPTSVKRRLAIGFAVLLVLGAVAVSQAKEDPNIPGFEPTVLGVSVSPKALVETRFDFWRTAVSIFADHPILGTGPDTYYANYTSKRPVENGADPFLQLENNPHNIFLAHAVGSGILGLGAYLLMVGSALLFAFRRIRNTAEPRMRLLLVAFTSLLVAYLTQGLVSIDHVPLAMLGWIAIGAIAVLAEPESDAAREDLAAARAKAMRENQPADRLPRRRLKAPVALICLLALFLLSVGARFLIADAKARESMGKTNLTDRMLLISQAFQLNPAEAEYHYLAGSTVHSAAITGQPDRQTREQLFRAARRQYGEALVRRPRSVIFLVSVARLDSAWGQALDKQHFVTAGESWRRVIALDPHNYRWHFQYSEMLGSSAMADNNNRQLRLAQIAELRKSIEIFRDQPDAWQRLVEAHRQIGETAQADAIRAQFFGEDVPGQNENQGSGETEPAAGAFVQSGRRPAAGLALALAVPLLTAIAWLRRMFVTAWRREWTKDKKKKVVPDRLHELIGATGAWSIAVAVPSAGALLGKGLAPGELRDLFLHLIPGMAALVLAFLCASRPYLGDQRPGHLHAIASLATFVTSLIAIVVQVPELFSGNGVRAAGGVLLHLAPLIAMFALVSLSVSRRPAGVAPTPRAAKESVDIA